jgi:ABC-type antimicrobial peptide transport system permease subunit
MNLAGNPVLIIFLLALVVIVTLLSGFYPAVVLARFDPIVALKSKMSARLIGGVSIRKGLVALQFTISHVLIIVTLIVVHQMDYFRNASLGFDKTAIVNVPIPGDSISATKIDYLKEQLAAHSGIKSLSFSFARPANAGNWYSDFKFDHSTKSTAFSANLKWADIDYFKTYNLEFVAGRPYFNSDTVRELVVNETLVEKLGFRDPQQVLGKQLDFWDGEVVANIVGVIKDFHANSLRDPIVPVVMGSWKDNYQMVGIKIKPEKLKETLGFIETTWNATYPDHVYEYNFLDEHIESFYSQENQLSQLYKIFAGIAIFISCLGLYGLVSFMAVQRTKEVGIRKVLGAGVARIVLLFSREFTIIIAISFLIAAPVAYLFIHNWLQDFTFRIQPGAGVFLTAIAGSIIIAWLTVGYRAIKAAIANPVTSLRTE